MLKLISETLVGGAEFSEIHTDPGDKDKVNSCCEKDHAKGKGEDNNKKKVPILPEIA